MAELQVHLIRSLRELCSAHYAGPYESFIRRLDGFHCLNFSLPWLEIVSPVMMKSDDCFFFVAVFAGAEFVGLAPFYLERIGPAGIGLRRLHFWGKSDEYLEYPIPGIVALNEYKQQCVGLVVNALTHRYRNEFDLINLTRVDPTDLLVESLSQTFTVFSNTDHTDQQHFFLNHQRIDEKLKGENLRRIRKTEEQLAQEFGDVEFTCLHELNDTTLDDIRQLHKRRQYEVINAGRSRISFFDDPIENKAIVRLIKYSQSIDTLRVYTLRVRGELFCFWVCFRCNGYSQAFITAFRQIAGHKYAAACLWRYMYKHEMETLGSHTIDTSFGTHTLKRKFSNHLVDLRTIVLQNQYSAGSRIRLLLLSLLRKGKVWLRGVRR